MGRLSRRAPVALIAAGSALAVALVATGIALTQRTDEVASVDGHAVTRDELVFHLRRLEPTMRNELRNGTAGEPIATRALADIRRDKTMLVLAGENGLAVSIDHAGFLAELEDENERRADAIAEGEVVYGLAEFSAEEYYSHRLAEVRTALKERLGAREGGPLQVTDAEVRRAFDADRAEWSVGATTYRYSKLVVPAPAGAGAASDAASLRRQVAAADRLADVAALVPGARLTSGAYEGGSARPTTHGPDLVPVFEQLSPGEISDPIPGTDGLTYYELHSETVDEEVAFAKYAQRIRQALVDEKFDRLLQRRIASNDLQVDHEAVAAVNAKDVQQ